MTVETLTSAGTFGRRIDPGSSTPTLQQLQETFVLDAERLMCRAGVSGNRLVTALYLILSAHTPARGPGVATLYACPTCRSDDAAPQYPCGTAQQASWALTAFLC